ncbi:MAG: hypothetical protein KDI14_01515 [Halioglobus sp.]|nr:hypothetical protein [Halioglobus sp.]
MNDGTAETEYLHRCARQLAAGELPPGWDIVPSSPLSRVACNTELKFFYKEFIVRSPLERLQAMLLGSRASKARKQNDALLYVGIEAPVSVAWGKLAGGREYLITRTAPGQDVASWLKTTLADRTGEPLARRRQLLEALGIFVGRVHATGFIAGDLQASNVIADLIEGRFQFSLIDNERTVKILPPPGRALLKNLMELNLLPPPVLSRTDRMRFFVAWRRQMRELSPIEAKVVAAEAFHWAMRLMYERGQL